MHKQYHQNYEFVVHSRRCCWFHFFCGTNSHSHTLRPTRTASLCTIHDALIHTLAHTVYKFEFGGLNFALLLLPLPLLLLFAHFSNIFSFKLYSILIPFTFALPLTHSQKKTKEKKMKKKTLNQNSQNSLCFNFFPFRFVCRSCGCCCCYTYRKSLGAVTAAIYSQCHRPELATMAIRPTTIAGIV